MKRKVRLRYTIKDRLGRLRRVLEFYQTDAQKLDVRLTWYESLPGIFLFGRGFRIRNFFIFRA